MKGLWAGRAWGISVGLISMAIAACAPVNDSDPAAIPVVVVSSSANLSASQTVRALAARSRVEKNRRAPTEIVLRMLDKSGNVISEEVNVDHKFVRRASTLPSAIASRSLSTYLPSGASLFDSTATTVVAVASSYDSTTAADTIATIPAYQVQYVTHTTNQPNDQLAATYYYNSVAYTGDPSYSSGADVIIATPSGYMEITATGNITVLENWGTFAYLRGAKTGASIGADTGVTMFTGTKASMTQADSCETQKLASIEATATFVGATILAGAATWFSFGLVGGAAVTAVSAAAINMVSKQVAFIACRQIHPLP